MLVLKHWKWNNINEGKTDDEGNPLSPKFTLVECLDENKHQIEERFKRVIVASGHSRAKKALFVREDLFKKLDKILLGGIDELAGKNKENQYPLYKKGCAKWNAYYGLVSTDSKVVSYVPNIVVIDDFKRQTEDTFDIVKQKKKHVNSDSKDAKNKYYKEYSVKDCVKKSCTIMPFDGAGLVSVECAKKWSEELNIKNKYGKSYVPAAFQIRVIPGIKGNLYTFDINEFAKFNGWIITDIKGERHDLRRKKVDIILTKSQTKFLDLYNNDITSWKEIFDKDITWYKQGTDRKPTETIECKYKRTFNISEYSEDLCDLNSKMLTAYQHLQTIENTDEEVKNLTQCTVGMLKGISTDINEFLRFRGCTDEVKRHSNLKEWERVPPYYRIAYYASEENKPIIFADRYFQNKVSEEIKGIKNRALSGKLYITGNYQVLTPDVYALAQFAFGKRENEVTGLLKSEEVYSAWWIEKSRQSDNFECNKLGLIRNPHIYMEARIATMISEKDKQQYDKVKKWFKYQATGIVTDSYSTIPLALGTADFDGDHIATTNCKEYINAVERARKEGKGNTIDIEYIDCTQEQKKQELMADVNNIQQLMNFDVLAYENNIGTVIDKVTMLWGKISKNIDDDYRNKIYTYVKIMDIIGQLTIDAAKSGEFEAIPKEINDYLIVAKILKPYFMKYLQKNEKKRRKEKSAFENASLFYGEDETQDKRKKQELFSSDATNLNRICWHMEREIENINEKFDEQNFGVEKFLKIFTTAKPNKTSPLYISLKHSLGELSDQHSTLYKELINVEAEETQKDRVNYYQYFYINSRNELLNVCRLSEEKSIDKVLNCLVYICYTERKFLDNDNAKNILYNCFADEMISRAKQDFTDKEIDYSGIEIRVNRTRDLQKRKLSKYLGEKPLYIQELERSDKEYNPIIIREEDIEWINKKISNKALTECSIKVNRESDLKKLYSVLMVISKRLECDRIVGKKKQQAHCINSFTIRQNSNNHINYASLAKLCGFDNYQRKNIKQRLKELALLGVIQVSDNCMANITVKVVYDNIGISDSLERSCVPIDDYKMACETLLGIVRVA